MKRGKPHIYEDMQMPKMKTKSGAKKRFRLTASGLVKAGQAGKRHGMIKRSKKFIRNQRGTTILSEADQKVVKKNFLPNGVK
jgi:large subunit ribosomal protein L35